MDVAASLDLYRRAIERDPDNIVLRARMADLHLRHGMVEDALVGYQQLVRRVPESVALRRGLFQACIWAERYQEAPDVLMEMADLLSRSGREESALEALQLAISLEPHHVEARGRIVDRLQALNKTKLAVHHLHQLAEAAVTGGDDGAALEAYTQLTRLSDDPTFLRRLAELHARLGESAKAAACYRSLIERLRAASDWTGAAVATERLADLEADNLQLRRELIDLYERLGDEERSLEQKRRLGVQLRDRGELQEARTLLEAVFRRQPRSVEVRSELVQVYLANADVESALEHVDALTEYYLTSGNLVGAIDLFSKLVAYDPANVVLRDALIRFYSMAGQVEEAVEQTLALAVTHRDQGAAEEAFKAYEQALELAPSRSDILTAASELAGTLGDSERALKYLRRAYQLEPDQGTVERLLHLLLQVGQVDEAAALLTRPDVAHLASDIIRQMQDTAERSNDPGQRLRLGILCFYQRQLDPAIEQFQRIRSVPGFELRALMMLGRAFAEQSGFNMVDLGLGQIRRALSLEGYPLDEYLEARYHLALLLQREGRLEEALKEFNEVLAGDIAYRDVRVRIQQLTAQLSR